MMAASFGIWKFACVLAIFFQDTWGQNIIPDTVQEFHACVGTTAYIPWPLNVVSRSGHDSTIITLTFQHRRSERKIPIATFNRHRKLIAEGTFRKRLIVSQENSGIFLKRVTLDDAGMFIAQARMRDGDMWTRSTNLVVHLRPIIVDEKLNLSIVRTAKGPSGRGDCITLSCGKLEYVGYPAAKFVWMSENKVLASEEATDDSYSTFEVCSPFRGQVSCAIAGHSSACTFDHVVSINLDLPGPPGNASAVKSGTTTSEYVLMIGMPALAIGIPVLVLAVWLLTHLIKSNAQAREARAHNDKDHYRENHQPSPSSTFITVNSPPSTSHYNQSLPSPPPIEDLSMSGSIGKTDKEDGLVRHLTHSPIRRKEAEIDRRPNTPHPQANESEDEDDDDDDEEEEDDSDEQPEDDHKEDQPLMEDSIPPTIL